MKTLDVIVKTPRGEVLRESVRSVRVPTETGQVGLRPRAEPLVLVVEPGLILLHRKDGTRFLGTAGGLLRCDGSTIQLMTPRAVHGDDEAEVVRQLTEQLREPSTEMEVRRTIGRIQSNILEELKRDRRRRQVGKEVSG